MFERKLKGLFYCGFIKFRSSLETILRILQSVRLTSLRRMASEVEKAQKADSKEEDTIFDKIIRKEIPAKVILENEDVSVSFYMLL